MGTFLQILLAVVLVIALLIAFGFFWLKRRLKRAIGDYSIANEVLSDLDLKPARIHLGRGDPLDYSKPFSDLLEHIKSLGFQRIADYEEHGGAYFCVLAARHKDLPIAVAITEDHAENVCFSMFAMNQDRKVVGRGNDPADAVIAGKVDWQTDAEVSAESALDDIRNQLSDTHLHFDLKLFRAVFEQVYALRADLKIVHIPTLESVEALAVRSGKPVSEEQVQTAYDMLLDHWKSQIDEVALDRYRRTSKIDAVAWEEMSQEIQVVHNHLENNEIAELLILDEVGEKILEQCSAQGLTGLQLYNAVNDLLPPNQQMKGIGDVDRPIKAQLYVPNDEIESDIQTARRYVYEAEDADGKSVQGSVHATGSGDAKQQVSNLGLLNAKLLIEPPPSPGNDEYDDLLIDNEAAAIAAKSTKEGIFSTMMRALVANWWIWAPPIGFLIKTNMDGPPLTWGDYVVFAWAAIAALAMIFLIAPMIFYNQLLLAQLRGKPGLAKFWIAALSLIGRFAAITPNQLTIERCKALAEEEKLGEALELIQSIRNKMSDEEYQAGLVSIYGVAGEWQPMMDAQRAYLGTTPAKETATVDLAMSVARYCDDVETAEPLLHSVRPSDLPEVALIGYQYVRGLIAAHRGQHQQALRHYAQAVETARQFETLPIMIGLIAEINGYAALAYKRSGQNDRAESLWQHVFPIIKPHHSSKRLISAYQEEEPDDK